MSSCPAPAAHPARHRRPRPRARCAARRPDVATATNHPQAHRSMRSHSHLQPLRHAAQHAHHRRTLQRTTSQRQVPRGRRRRLGVPQRPARHVGSALGAQLLGAWGGLLCVCVCVRARAYACVVGVCGPSSLRCGCCLGPGRTLQRFRRVRVRQAGGEGKLTYRRNARRCQIFCSAFSRIAHVFSRITSAACSRSSSGRWSVSK